MDNKVKVKSLISSRVVISVPDMRLRRVWEKKGAVKIIPFGLIYLFSLEQQRRF